MRTTILRRLLLSVLTWLNIGVSPDARADRFNWESGTSGNFTDPNRWHGPDFPAHTRFPLAGDDASILRGPLTVTITGDQASNELVVDEPTLNIASSYTVASIFGLGAPFTVTGKGALNVTLWQLGALSIVDGAKANVSLLQPLGSSPPSELLVRTGAQVTSQTLDQSRGGLKVTVEGGGATWKHAATLPNMQLYLRANGRAELSATDGVFVDAEGGGAQLTASETFSGYGRIANGARIDCAEGFHPLAGGSTTIDGGTWAVQQTFINDGADLTIQNGGLLSAGDIRAGQFSSATRVNGPGSRITVANILKHTGGIQLLQGGSLTCDEAQLDFGFVYAEAGGTFNVAGDIFNNNGVNLINGGLLKAGSINLADMAGRGGSLNVKGAGSAAETTGGLAVGQRGTGSLTVANQGRVTSTLGGLGIFAGADGQATVSGAKSDWTINPVPGGGALLVGDAGLGVLALDSGGTVRVTAPSSVILGRAAGGDGTIRATGFASFADLRPASVIVGQRGQGAILLDAESELQAERLSIGQSGLDNRVTTTGQGTILSVFDEAIVGDGGRGTLLLQRGAHGVIRRLAIGRNSQADNRVSVEGPNTKLAGPGRIDVGELNGRGRLEMSDTAEARPGEGLSVGIYDGSNGTLLVDRTAFILTTEDAIIGGGASSQATATFRGGGSLAARDILIFAKPSGVTTVYAKDQHSYLEAIRQMQVGFVGRASGSTLLRASDGAFVSVGSTLTIGNSGKLDATGGRVKVGAVDDPPIGTVRVGPRGLLEGFGSIQGRIEVLAGGVVAPGSSPGTLTVEGDYAPQTGARLEIEISGTVAGVEHDVLHVTGVAALGGTLAIKFIDGFAPRAGQSYAFLKADGGINGAFANVEITGVAAGFSHQLVSTASGVLSLSAQSDGIAKSPPLLKIHRVGASVAVSWPATGGWVLESTVGLPGGWLAVTTAPVLQGERYIVSVPAVAPTALFRLRQ